jgi:hypothetical protein
MSGLGGQAERGKLVTIRTDLPDSIDGILEKIRQILLLGEVHSLTLRLNEPITYQRLLREGSELKLEETSQGFAELTIMDVVRNVPMEDFHQIFQVLVGDFTPHQMLLHMFMYVVEKGLQVTHVVTAPYPGTYLWSWLGLKQLRAPEFLFGARVEEDKELNPDVFLLCGARTKLATISEIGFVLKGSADAPIKDERG